jgi:hypothetical protein
MADEAADREREPCLSLNRHGVRCEGQRGHASLHTARADGMVYIWSDAESLAVALNLTPND